MEAIQSVEKVTRENFLPYALPSIGDDEIAEVVDSLRSGWVTTGPKVKQFEADFAAYTGASHAIAVSSCTAALHVALTALGIGPGDEVIVPTITFCATANVVVHLGAKPVLVEIGRDLNIMPEAIEAAITPKTKAIMPVHYGGQSCNLEVIYQIAAYHNLAVVEDAAHAIGSTYHGEKIGADTLHQATPGLKRVTAYSFYATKNMTTGEGGMIATDDDDLAEHMRLLTLHGMNRDAWKRYTSAGSWYYQVVLPGYKSNMTDIQAAIGIHQLRRLDDFIAIRQAYAKRYDTAFADLPAIITPMTHSDRNHIYHLYAVRLDLNQLSIDRAQFIDEMKAHNIGTSVHFIPIHLHEFYQEKFGYQRGDLPYSEASYDSIVSLPLYPRMTDIDVQDVIDAVYSIVEYNRR